MLVLAIETSTNHGSLVLFDDNKVASELNWNKSNSHSEVITTKCEELLTNNSINLKDIDLFAAGIGPGSFTGLRVAINFAKTCAMSQQRPVLGKNSFELLAAPLAADYKKIRVAIYAFRNLIYTCSYSVKDKKLNPFNLPVAVSFDDFLKMDHTDFALCGDLKALGSQFESLSDLRPFPDKETPKASSFQYFSHDFQGLSPKDSWENLTPLYIRASEAEEKLGKKQ